MTDEKVHFIKTLTPASVKDTHTYCTHMLYRALILTFISHFSGLKLQQQQQQQLSDEMERWVLFPLLLLQLPLTTTQGGHWDDYKYGQQGSELQESCCSWKCILFTLQWPGGFCQSLDKETPCMIPEGVNSWTIHGLWPLHSAQCCHCWPMFHSDVQELEAELNKRWPSLVKTKPSFAFWRDEWNKHGVCAACVEGMNSPQRYFQTCLKLRGQFDIQKLLEEAGITPSCQQPYKVAEVHSVLAPHLGYKHEIQCVRDGKGREVWFQVKIPLSHNLTVGCDQRSDAEAGHHLGRSPSSAHPCPPMPLSTTSP